MNVIQQIWQTLFRKLKIMQKWINRSLVTPTLGGLIQYLISHNCPSVSEVTLKTLGNHANLLKQQQNKTKHNKIVYLSHGIYCGTRTSASIKPVVHIGSLMGFFSSTVYNWCHSWSGCHLSVPALQSCHMSNKISHILGNLTVCSITC